MTVKNLVHDTVVTTVALQKLQVLARNRRSERYCSKVSSGFCTRSENCSLPMKSRVSERKYSSYFSIKVLRLSLVSPSKNTKPVYLTRFRTNGL